jgi:hypothetical protein
MEPSSPRISIPTDPKNDPADWITVPETGVLTGEPPGANQSVMDRS